jgi:hypothetical protein
MRSHADIDRRSLILAQAVVERIDKDPRGLGISRAREICNRWCSRSDQQAAREWRKILSQSWVSVKSILLEDTERGRRLRQNSPFCGILTPRERWSIYRDFNRASQ